ncbi:MAG: DNA-3-methyladenine glycosylase [Burkholderiaceae bacterium]|nr:MAG: DNA-3-methyladenine glycosylase [Burkholderiaceae bacterium]
MPNKLKKLPRNFFNRSTILVAHEILGTFLVHTVEGEQRIGRVVEVEAYLGPTDLAAHTSKGLTHRTRAMFGPPGHAYVYLVYGMHTCMNVVTEPEGTGTAILLRALEPVQNVPAKTSGPALLCKAMGITLADYGRDLCGDDFHFAMDPSAEPISVVERPRIGVDYAGEWAQKPLRFYVEGNKYISKK